ncbi:hypothetical protein ACC771_17015 [Rhizobium ruizarguesonis]
MVDVFARVGGYDSFALFFIPLQQYEILRARSGDDLGRVGAQKELVLIESP